MAPNLKNRGTNDISTSEFNYNSASPCIITEFLNKASQISGVLQPEQYCVSETDYSKRFQCSAKSSKHVLPQSRQMAEYLEQRFQVPATSGPGLEWNRGGMWFGCSVRRLCPSIQGAVLSSAIPVTDEHIMEKAQ